MMPENIRQSSTLFHQIRIADFVALYFSLTGLGLQMIAYEKDYYNMISDVETSTEKQHVQILMWIAFSFNLIHVISLVLRHLIYFKWLYVKRLITKYDTLTTTGYWKTIMGEIVIQSIIPFPFTNELYYFESNGRFKAKNIVFKYNHILLAFMTFSRIYQIIKALLLITYWTSPRAQRICGINGSKAYYLFAIKSIMKEKPYKFLLTSLFISVIQLGYCLRIFERQLTSQSGQDFNLMSNTIWNVIITMTTVGYGDIYPKTTMGRLIGVVVALWGLFLVSIFTVTLANLFTFSNGEQKAFQLSDRLKLKDELRVSAANVLGSSFKSMKVKKLHSEDKDAIKNAVNDYKKQAIAFFQIAKAVRMAQTLSSDTDHLRHEISDLMKKIKEMDYAQAQLKDICKAHGPQPVI